MDGARGTYWKEDRCLKRFWWGNLKEKDHFENKGGDGRIIL
jgi:hypothetical protein